MVTGPKMFPRKGGVSGLTAPKWRESLKDEFNSNWQAIDRDMATCTGIWNFVGDPDLQKALCYEWVLQFWRSFGFATDDVPPGISYEAVCTSTPEMQSLIEFAQDTSVRKKSEALAEEKKACEGKEEGNFYDAEKKECRLRQCLCTVQADLVLGSTGTDCLYEGATDCEGCCLEKQRASCESFDECFKEPGYAKKRILGDLQCQAATCKIEYDKDTCCQPEKFARTFKVEFDVTDWGNCGKSDTVTLWLKGYDTKNREVDGKHVEIDGMVTGTTAKVTYQAGDELYPQELCIVNHNAHDALCLDEIRVYNNDVEKLYHIGNAPDFAYGDWLYDGEFCSSVG